MIAMDTILIVNAGSSSVKFQIFTVEGEGYRIEFRNLKVKELK